MTDLHLSEGGDPLLVHLDDEVGDRLAASKVVDAHRAGGGLWEIAAGTKVGVATVAGQTVWITPKVDISRILFMLGYARDAGWLAEDVELAPVPDLVPALAKAFADQAERAVEAGLIQGYVEVDDSLTVLRGRLRDQDQLRQRFGLPLPLLVRYDDYTVDTPENRLLRAAVESLLRLPGVDAATRQRLRGLRLLLADVGVYRSGPALAWLPTRLNARYHVALWLAELVVAGNAVDQAPGDVRVNGFLVDMAKVFEDFLIAALTQSFVAFGGTSRRHAPSHLDTLSRITMEPDLVWYLDSKAAAVIDAKYKAEKPSGFPYADLYQMLAYCIALNLPKGHLVYAKGNEAPASHTVRNAGVTILTHALDLASEPKEILAQIDHLAERVCRRLLIEVEVS